MIPQAYEEESCVSLGLKIKRAFVSGMIAPLNVVFLGLSVIEGGYLTSYSRRM